MSRGARCAVLLAGVVLFALGVAIIWIGSSFNSARQPRRATSAPYIVLLDAADSVELSWCGERYSASSVEEREGKVWLVGNQGCESLSSDCSIELFVTRGADVARLSVPASQYVSCEADYDTGTTHFIEERRDGSLSIRIGG